MQALLWLGIALCFSAASRNVKRPISVLIRPAPASFKLGGKVVVKVAVNNDSGHKVWFTTCPDPYTVEMTDSNGRIVPHKPPPAGTIGMMICTRNILYTIAAGETWTTEIPIDEMFDLKAETYELRLLWHFPWNVRKTPQGTDWDTLTVSSNTTSLTVTE